MVPSLPLAQETCLLMRYFVTPLMLLAAMTLAGCSSDDDLPENPTQPTPVQLTESFSETLNVNGARTHTFVVQRAGTVTAQLKAVSIEGATIGISLGAYNGSACAFHISKTDAVLNSTLTGTANSTGDYCVWVNDVGKLADSLVYTIEVTHY
jgi:hypothetical protein